MTHHDQQERPARPKLPARDSDTEIGDAGFVALPDGAVPGRRKGVPSLREAADRLGVSESTMRRYRWEWDHPERTRWEWEFYGSRQALWGGLAGFTIGAASFVAIGAVQLFGC